jgi:ubiquinone/menaquinone biosynthesis C-methylase UbiE
MKKESADKILNEIESGYDLVSDKFSETRKHFWRDLEFIGNYAKDGDSIFDYGCGNGRLLELFSDKKINYFGVDISEKLINLAKNKYSGENIHFSKINPSQISLAFNDDFFNAVYSVAVFHHMPGKTYREDIAKELYRITKPGGYVIMTVWNLWSVCNDVATSGGQKKYIGEIIKNWWKKVLGKSFLDWNDCYITFKNNQGEVFKRYHHAFTKREISRLLLKAGFKKEAVKIGKNIVFIGKK